MGTGIKISIRNEAMELLPQRGIHWPRKNTLIITDLHWGKSETFRIKGIPIPEALMEEELKRLSQLIEETKVSRVVVLGDLIHSKIGITESLKRSVAEWRKTFSGQILVVKGNHDRHWKSVPKDWGLDWTPCLEEDPFLFCHEPKGLPGSFVWAGHLHPTFRIRSHTDSLRLPCFHVSDGVGVLPAFNFFTRGIEMPKSKTDRVFVIAENKVIEI